MGFLDKVKSAAQDVAQETKKATATAQSKIEQSQIRKKMDEAAKELGYLVFRERAQGIPAGTDADRLVSEISSLEAELREEASPPEPPQTPPPSAPA